MIVLIKSVFYEAIHFFSQLKNSRYLLYFTNAFNHFIDSYYLCTLLQQFIFMFCNLGAARIIISI
jgi:hypothetical protein